MRLTYSIFTVALLIMAGCKEKERESAHMPMDYDWYEDRLEAITDVEEKWYVTKEFLQASSERTGVSAEMIMVTQIRKRTSGTAELWLRSYPEITQHVTLGVDDLKATARGLGFHERSIVHSNSSSGSVEGRVYWSSELTEHQAAVAWLRILTGEEFSDKASFNAWLERNEHDLYWEKAEGRFVLRLPE